MKSVQDAADTVLRKYDVFIRSGHLLAFMTIASLGFIDCFRSCHSGVYTVCNSLLCNCCTAYLPIQPLTMHSRVSKHLQQSCVTPTSFWAAAVNIPAHTSLWFCQPTAEEASKQPYVVSAYNKA